MDMGMMPIFFWSIKKCNLIKLTTFLTTFIPATVTVQLYRWDAQYAVHCCLHITEQLRQEVTDYTVHCCRPEFSPKPLLSLHYRHNVTGLFIAQGWQLNLLGLPAVFATTRCSVLEAFLLVLHQMQCLCAPIYVIAVPCPSTLSQAPLPASSFYLLLAFFLV